MMDDSKIVDMYLSRDENVISMTSEKYGSRLRSMALRILGDLPSSEECENDTYLKAWGLIPPNEPRTYLFAFLGRITRHLAIDTCRKRSASKRSALLCELTDEMAECIPDKASTESAADSIALKEAVNSFLKSLSSEQRIMFIRRYWYFDSVSDLCSRCGWSQSKVKTSLYRLREKFRNHLEKEGFEI